MMPLSATQSRENLANKKRIAERLGKACTTRSSKLPLARILGDRREAASEWRSRALAESMSLRDHSKTGSFSYSLLRRSAKT